MKNKQIEKQLMLNKKREEYIEYFFIGVILLAMAVCGKLWLMDGSLYQEFQSYSEWPLKMFVVGKAVLGLAVIGSLLLLLIEPLVKSLNYRFAPTWVIEDCGDVVKVHGSVGLMECSKVKLRMLMSRPGLVFIDKAWEKYGCTMAAVSAHCKD